VKYQCIEARREQYPIRMMCRLLEVSKSCYYSWRTRLECKKAKNLLQKNFNIELANQCRVADITYINTNQGWQLML